MYIIPLIFHIHHYHLLLTTPYHSLGMHMYRLMEKSTQINGLIADPCKFSRANIFLQRMGLTMHHFIIFFFFFFFLGQFDQLMDTVEAVTQLPKKRRKTTVRFLLFLCPPFKFRYSEIHPTHV